MQKHQEKYHSGSSPPPLPSSYAVVKNVGKRREGRGSLGRQRKGGGNSWRFTVERPCDVCGHVSVGLNAHYKHIRTHKTYKCKQCGQTFLGEEGFVKHKRKAHPKTFPCQHVRTTNKNRLCSKTCGDKILKEKNMRQKKE